MCVKSIMFAVYYVQRIDPVFPAAVDMYLTLNFNFMIQDGFDTTMLMVWLAGNLQSDLATAANYVEDQRQKISRDGFSA